MLRLSLLNITIQHLQNERKPEWQRERKREREREREQAQGSLACDRRVVEKQSGGDKRQRDRQGRKRGQSIFKVIFSFSLSLSLLSLARTHAMLTSLSPSKPSPNKMLACYLSSFPLLLLLSVTLFLNASLPQPGIRIFQPVVS